MFRSGRLTLPYGAHQLPSVEVPQRRLHAALGDPGVVGDVLVAGAHALHSLAVRAAPEVDVDDERGRRAVVANEVAEQRLEDVAVEAECLCGYGNQDYSRYSDR